MRILHLYKDYAPVVGGIENLVKTLAEAQVRNGHHVSVLVCAPGMRPSVRMEQGVRVVRAGRLCTAASMPLSLDFVFRLCRERPDVTHIHSPFPLGEWAHRQWGRGATVISHHADVVRQKRLLALYSPIYRRVLRGAHRIIAASPAYRDGSPWLSPHRAKCRLVPYGIDSERFSPGPDEKDPYPTILFTGKHRYYKDVGTLLKAVVQVPDARLRILGDGPMRAQWESEAAGLGLGRRVEFLGEVSDADLPAHYRRAHVFVLPSNSRAEAFGMVLLEAMASGLPCVTTEIGTGTSWIVQHGVTGFVVPPRNPEAMAHALNQLVENEDLRCRMGAAGRKRVETSFRIQDMVSGVEEVYRQVHACRPSKIGG